MLIAPFVLDSVPGSADLFFLPKEMGVGMVKKQAN